MYDGTDVANVTASLAGRFEAHREHLRGIAYRMLGSLSDAEDAVQESWLRMSRADVAGIASLRAWLTTVVSRICLDMLRTRASRREDPSGTRIPDPVVTPAAIDTDGPEAQAVRTDSVSLALMIVLEHLEPAERVAFVLHDVFDMPFGDIAPIVGRTTAATRQLASRARRTVVGRAPAPDADRRAQRRAVEAFLAAVQKGDFDALMDVLDPDVVLRADGGRAQGMSRTVRGAAEVAAQARAFSKMGLESTIVLVNGNVGVLSRLPDGRILSVIGYTIVGGRVAGMDILADPERLARLHANRLLPGFVTVAPGS